MLFRSNRRVVLIEPVARLAVTIGHLDPRSVNRVRTIVRRVLTTRRLARMAVVAQQSRRNDATAATVE